MKPTILVILSLSALNLTGQCLTASVPDNAVVTRTSLELSGEAKGDEDFVYVSVFGSSSSPLLCQAIRGSIQGDGTCALRIGSGRMWRTTIQLDPAIASLIRIEQPSCRPSKLEILVTTAPPEDLQLRPAARFQVDWAPEAEVSIAQIGREVLGVDPPVDFVSSMKKVVMNVVHRYLNSFDIRIDATNSPNKIYIVKDRDERAYARTIVPNNNNCGGKKTGTETQVYIGTLKHDITTRRPSWAVLDHGNPVRLSEDIAQTVGTIIAHEVLHAVGLLQCGWMQGDEGAHHDPRFERGSGRRYASGEHLMDPFTRVSPKGLVGRHAPAATDRNDLLNDSFSANYLRMIHPLR